MGYPLMESSPDNSSVVSCPESRYLRGESSIKQPMQAQAVYKKEEQPEWISFEIHKIGSLVAVAVRLSE